MSVQGVFALFPDLDTISASEIAELSHQQFEHHNIENHLANRILYPQSIAQTKSELDIDFWILTLAIRKHPETFFDSTQNRIVIPEVAAVQLSPLTRLISVILQNIPAQNITDIWVKDGTQQILGSAIPWRLIQSLNLPEGFDLYIPGESKTLVPGQLNLIPIKQKHLLVKLGESAELSVVGGSLGLFVDLRKDI